ncbi:hypothetical protein [uncultured Winogradskyella sp.]|uniref:hypothetical protein n=1 Tax=uncultured Winogradskyella sp. TaxID=395353 RepID=UPI00262883A4|nr:hypothetical protein [uncultured Winogradskyella sp.]
MSQRIPKMIAMGKIAADGSIIKATPGIKVRLGINPGSIREGQDIGYSVKLPDRLVCDKNYIIQLTAESYFGEEDFFTMTSISSRYQTKKGFEVIIWGDVPYDTLPGLVSVPVKSDWHFVLYDML